MSNLLHLIKPFLSFRSVFLLAILLNTLVYANSQPDLLIQVIDSSKGQVVVKNEGMASSPASKLYVVCSYIKSGLPATSSSYCAKGLGLPNYIAKWNTLSIEIPPLAAGEKYSPRLFGPRAFPGNPGEYAIKLTIDPLKAIVESNESNNFAHFIRFVKAQPGMLTVVAQSPKGQQLSKFTYYLLKPGDTDLWRAVLSGIDKPSPQRFTVAPGVYDLRVRHYQRYIGSKHPSEKQIKQAMAHQVFGADQNLFVSNINIKSGQKLQKKLIIPEPASGTLELNILADGKPVKARVGLGFPEDTVLPDKVFKSYPIWLSSPMKMNLFTGDYQLQVVPEDKGGVYQNAGYGSQLLPISIQSGKTLKKTINFKLKVKGQLNITVLLNGKRVKAQISIRKSGTKDRFGVIRSSYNLLSNKAQILPGNYDFSILPLDIYFSPGGVDFFHGRTEGPDIKTRRIKGIKPVILSHVEIKSGETYKQKVDFNNLKK